MTPDIIRKLTAELDAGITTEIQVVYLLAGIRKIIERDNSGDKYPDLKFHCDWALHSSMDRAAAKAVLRQFDAAYPLLQTNIKLQNLPQPLRSEIDRVSQMRSFETELGDFLNAYGLPPITLGRHDGWVHFLHLYTKVIEDIPLVVAVPAVKNRPRPAEPVGPPQHISHVVVNFEEARDTIKHDDGEDLLFKVTWTIHDKNGRSGSIFIINSFSLQPATETLDAARPIS
jgi:hypothetical protein